MLGVWIAYILNLVDISGTLVFLLHRIEMLKDIQDVFVEHREHLLKIRKGPFFEERFSNGSKLTKNPFILV